jgi:hypothetical protein
MFKVQFEKRQFLGELISQVLDHYKTSLKNIKKHQGEIFHCGAFLFTAFCIY